jgi:protein required for attachment to host cells
MKKAKLWYVIADGGRARFIEQDESGAFRTVLSFVAAELHERSHDLGRDRPARVKESANAARHAVAPRRDLHEAAKEDFIAIVSEKIASEHDGGQFDRLVLVAPPRVLTELKQKLSKPMAQLIVKDLQKDLTKVPDHELAGHLLPTGLSHSGLS